MSTGRPIRVLHMIDTLERGGAETLLLDVFRNCSPADLELHLLATGGGTLEQDFRETGHHLIRRDRRGALDPGLCLFIRRYCKQHAIDVIHSHQIVSGLHAVIAVALLGIPVIHSIHGFTEDRKNNLALRFLLRRTAANVLVSHSMADMLRSNERIRRIPHCHVVYNGVDPLRVIPTTGRQSVREELGLDPHDTLIGMVGNIYEVKDHELLCKAMTLLAPTHPELHCVMVGRIDNPGIYERCQQIIQEAGIEAQVHFIGARTDVARILQSLDAFVFATKKDTFGLALVEAMMACVPCLASDIPVMREISANGHYVQLFDADHPGVAAMRIEMDLLDPLSARQRAHRALSYAHDTFSIRSSVYALREVYFSLRRAGRTQEIDPVTDIPVKST